MCGTFLNLDELFLILNFQGLLAQCAVESRTAAQQDTTVETRTAELQDTTVESRTAAQQDTDTETETIACNMKFRIRCFFSPVTLINMLMEQLSLECAVAAVFPGH